MKNWPGTLGQNSNMNEVIRAVLNFLFILFYFPCIKSHQKAQKSTKKHQKHKKHKNATKQKHKNANKQTKIKNVLKRYLRGEKPLMRIFVLPKKKQKSICNGNVGPNKLVKVLSALYEQKLVDQNRLKI